MDFVRATGSAVRVFTGESSRWLSNPSAAHRGRPIISNCELSSQNVHTTYFSAAASASRRGTKYSSGYKTKENSPRAESRRLLKLLLQPDMLAAQGAGRAAGAFHPTKP